MNRLSFFLFITIGLQTFHIGYAQKANDQLDSIIKQYQEHKAYSYQEYPLGRYDEALFRNEADFANALLKDIDKLDTASLSDENRINVKLLKFVLEDKVNRYKYKMHLNPIQADQGFHLNLNYQVRPITSYKNAVSYLNRLKAIPYFTKSQIKMIEKGLEEGIDQPKVIFNGYNASYDTHIVEDPENSYFYSPFMNLPNTLSDHQKDSLQQAALKVVKDSVVPSFKRIKEFFENEYIPNARKAIGVSARPNGKDFYQNRINYYTTSTQYTAESIHELGLKEVARIRKEMKEIIAELGFDGSFDDFLHFLRTDKQFYANSGEDLLTFARDICKRIDAQLPAYFNRLPRQPYGVIPVPDAMAPKYTAGRYSGNSINGTQPGYFLVNTYKLESRPLYALPALAAHESVPGHHLQIALNSELKESVPGFRRNLYLSVYGEGWALYTEQLADEMGIYRTPYEKFGQLTYEMWRACRLVVDTGIHALGWSRQQVIDFMSQNTALSLHEINTETDRYIGWPGQALSYKIGELKIKELRAKAEKELGADFDIREFHHVILKEGTVTIPILEDQVNTYIAKKRSK
ncbi:Uncharacterized conserved protein, DUF885 familyt [Zhouia amylolytica]|uniref:Uncharacterized conserved protein, DUF885 familyt n=1 Tax=Zhouia amylolytica TaxID=376730 RepID=A0A1I6P1B2_9FLAO|nr:DUF885 domain-containing protein [Zhouia amylolytica]SFS33999.1 Uncharacterized conserved protein, DUF885 familyt [Zhouia amylolytica]